MSSVFYQIANVFFFVFHILFILFNLFGWLKTPLRKWNLFTLSLTAFSWFVLGVFYGFGYCFLTDWHWLVRERLGYAIESDSYIHFLIITLTNFSISAYWVDALTAFFFFAALSTSVVLNWRDRKKKIKVTEKFKYNQ